MREKIRVVFLDRDGTLNPDQDGYIDHPERFELYPYSGRAIKDLNDKGFFVFLITNQSGIARGYYSFEDLEQVHTEMKKQLDEAGAHIDEIFVSPHYAGGSIEPYNIEHEDRKPGLGLFKKAVQKYEINISGSFMIGDKYSDIEFGKKAGLRTILVLSGNGMNEFLDKRKEWRIKPDLVAKDLSTAVSFILKFGD